MLAIFSGEKSPNFAGETFSERVQSGYRVLAEYEFLSESEFLTRFGHAAKDTPGIVLDSLINELGKPQAGVLLKTDAPRRLQLYADSGAFLDTCLHDSQQQLRAKSGKEVADWHQAELQKTAPKAWAGKGVSEDDVKSLVSHRQEQLRAIEAHKKELAANLLAGQPQPTPEPPPEEPPAAQESSEDEREELVSPDKRLIAPNHQSPKRKKGAGTKGCKDDTKGKGSGRGGGGKGQSMKRMAFKPLTSAAKKANTGALETASGLSQDGVSTSVGDSSASSRGRESSVSSPLPSSGSKPRSKDVQTKFNRYRRVLTVDQILSGETNGREIWQCTATLDAAELKDGGCVQTVLLRGQVEICKHALNLTASYIKKVSTQERKASIAALLEQGYTQFPMEIEVNLLEVAFRDLKITDPNHLDILVTLLDPGCQLPWEASMPYLGTSSLDVVEKGNLLHRLLLNETLIPLITKGEGAAQATLHLANRIAELYAPYLERNLSPIMELTVKDVLQCARCLQVLLSTDENQEIEGLMADVDAVGKAKAGCLSNVAQVQKRHKRHCKHPALKPRQSFL